MLTIYGNDFSSPCNKVRFAANALDLKYDYVQLNMREGEHKSEKYLKLHPFGKVPVINDDGFILFESNAIIKYLADKHDSSFYPENTLQRAIIDQWLDFTSIHIGHAMGRVFFNRVIASVFGMEADERSMKDGVKFLKNFLPVIDDQFGQHAYLAGAEMTVADFALLATLDPAEAAQIDLSSYENLNKWRSELKEKDFYQQCFNDYNDVLMAMKG